MRGQTDQNGKKGLKQTIIPYETEEKGQETRELHLSERFSEGGLAPVTPLPKVHICTPGHVHTLLVAGTGSVHGSGYTYKQGPGRHRGGIYTLLPTWEAYRGGIYPPTPFLGGGI